jgi:hypothetical protein
MRAEAAQGAMSSYSLGLRCECGARRSDGSRRWCAECRYANATGESGRRRGLLPRHGGAMLMVCSRGCAAMLLWCARLFF